MRIQRLKLKYLTYILFIITLIIPVAIYMGSQIIRVRNTCILQAIQLILHLNRKRKKGCELS